MSTSPHQRDAQFQIWLDQILSGQETIHSILSAHPDEAAEVEPALRAAVWLVQRRSTFDPRPGFIRASRHLLVDKIRESGRQVKRSLWEQIQLALRSPLAVRLALALFLAAVLLTTHTVANAAQTAIPGDTVYPVKVTLEMAQSKISLDREQKIILQTQFVQRRLAELEWLVLEGRSEYMLSTAQDLELQVQTTIELLNKLEKEDPERAQLLAATLVSSLETQRPVLDVLIQMIPDPYQAGVLQAVQLAYADLQPYIDTVSPSNYLPALAP